MTSDAADEADAPVVDPEVLDARGNRRTKTLARLHGQSRWVAATGMLISLVLVIVADSAHDENEDRLLRQRVREAAAVLTAALPAIESQLASAAEIVEVAEGSEQESFQRLMSRLVEDDDQYVSASLWRIGDEQPRFVVGEQPKLARQSADDVRAVLERAVSASGLSVTGLLDGPDPRLVYTYATSDSQEPFVAALETALPRERTANVPPPGSAFSGLDNAVYLGDSERTDRVLIASRPDLPLTGRRASEQIPFGDTELTLVMSPTSDLGGRLMRMLPWLVGIAGIVTTLGATALIERLLRREQVAESLSRENATLYANQLSVTRTLQRSFLPDRLPTLESVEVAGRYLPGAVDVDIGGDWYDVIDIEGDRMLAVVGDVSGHGVGAATHMATLRSAFRAFATESDSPSELLQRLSRMLDVERDGHFATVLCACLDVATGEITLASAGHPQPLIVDADTAVLAQVPVGTPIGVTDGAAYTSCALALSPGETILMFTDGLFERRAESVDAGLARLRSVATQQPYRSLGELIDGVVDAQIGEGVHDDAAVLGVRWTPVTTTQTT